MKWAFDIGQAVRPLPEWSGDPNEIPSGAIVARETWGRDGCYRIEGDRRFFAAYVFEATP